MSKRIKYKIWCITESKWVKAWSTSELTQCPNNAAHVVSSENVIEDDPVIQNNFTAIINPTSNDDIDSGYEVGSKWVNTITSKEYCCVDNTSGAAAWSWSAGPIENPSAIFHFFADQMDFPNNSDWIVNAAAPASVDSNNNGIVVRLFDDATEEGVGLIVEIPPGATNILFHLRSRSETSSAFNLGVVPRLYVREFPDNTAVESWSSGTDMSAITMGTSNEYFQYDSETISLNTLGLVNGRVAQIELTRNPESSSDTLVGDWSLLEVKISFS